MEKRYRLSEAQLEAVREADARVQVLETALNDALRHGAVVQRLVYDALGITEKPLRQVVDPTTQELVVVYPDPAPASTPAGA